MSGDERKGDADGAADTSHFSESPDTITATVSSRQVNHERKEPPPLLPIYHAHHITPKTDGIVGDRIIREVYAQRRVTFSVTKYLAEAWHFFQYNFHILIPAFVLVTIVYLSVYVVIAVIMDGVYGGPDNQEERRADEESSHLNSFKSFGIYVLLLSFLSALECVVLAPFQIGLFSGIFRALRQNNRMVAKDYAAAYECAYFPTVIPVCVVILLVSRVSYFIFFPLSGLTSFFAMFVYPLHLEHRGLGLQSIVYSCKFVCRYLCDLIGCVFLLLLLNVFGLLMAGVGVFVTLPISFLVLAFCYHHIVGILGVPHINDLISASLSPQYPHQQPPLQACASPERDSDPKQYVRVLGDRGSDLSRADTVERMHAI